MADKVISVVFIEGSNKLNVYYRDKLIGSWDRMCHSNEQVAAVIEAAVDECIERQKERLMREGMPLLVRALNEAFVLGCRWTNGFVSAQKRDSLWNDIVKSLKFW